MDYLEQLEREQAEELRRAGELEDFWYERFPGAKWVPPDSRFLWWVRNYDDRILRYAITTASMNLNHGLSPVRLGKYVSAVCRNVAEQARAASNPAQAA